MNSNRLLHTAIIVEDIYSKVVIQKWNTIPIHVSNREPIKSKEVENDYKITGKTLYHIIIFTSYKNHDIPYYSTSVIILLTT